MEISKDVIRAYALENAIRYKGKASFGSVLSALFTEGLQKYHIQNYTSIINDIIAEVNELDLNAQIKDFAELKNLVSKRKERTGLPELPNAVKGEVVMRFAPFPSGPLHIGNARPLILNDQYAKDYAGKLILAMDDTIGSEDKPIEEEAYDLIVEGADWLGVKYDKNIFYKSDRIEAYYKYAEELIKKGYMYVCECSQEEFKEHKENGKDCACRNMPEEQQLKRWKMMFDKKAKEGQFVVRLKTDMNYPDPAFRDRVMFKISDRTHPRVGNKYRIYPTMEFSWAIDNHILGVTHIIRGIELSMETKVEEFIRNIFGWNNPEVIYNGHLILEGVKISKSKGAQEVKSGKYTGWNDPRLWSLQALRDRGIYPEAVREFILMQGVKKSNTTVPIDVLYSINKKFIEDNPRYFFVEKPIKISIKGCPNLIAEIPLHPNQKLGYKKYKTKQDFFIAQKDYIEMENNNYRLMHLLNFKSRNLSIFKPKEFSFISEESNPDLDVKYIHWLIVGEDNVKVHIRMPNGDICEGLGEPLLKKLNVGDIIQFERFGFVRLHKKEKDFLEFWWTHK